MIGWPSGGDDAIKSLNPNGMHNFITSIKYLTATLKFELKFCWGDHHSYPTA